MKRGIYLLTILLCTGFVFLSSCKKDDAPTTVTPDPVTNLPPDYVALKAFYDANPSNTLNWDLDDTTMGNWEGVTQENDRVKELSVVAKGISTVTSSVGDLDMLTSLRIAENSASSMPSELGNLTNLTELFLNDNALTSIPDEIGNLVNLGELNLSGNSMKGLPEGLGNLAALSHLDAHENSLESLPVGIMDLSKLTYLDISDNVLTQLPTPADVNSSGWEELLELYATNNAFTSLPPLGNSKKLEKVDFSNNALSFIPPAFNDENQHEGLKELYLNDNALEIVPSELGGLVSLNVMDVSNNKLIGLPTAVCDLETNYGTELRKDTGVDCVAFSDDYQALVVFYNANPDNTLGWDLNDITMQSWSHIGLSSDGRVLELSGGDKNLDSIPPVIGNLKSMRFLLLFQNNLTSLPPELGALNSLIELDLLENKLTTLPEEIGMLTNLNMLYLNDNQISEIPINIIELSNLKELDLRDNEITEVPKEIANLKNLSQLILSNNSLSTLPLELGNFESLQLLGLLKNPITSLPDEVCALTNSGTTIELDDPAICAGGTPPVSEYEALKELAEVNNNKMGWDLADTSMLSWDGVIIAGGHVTRLELAAKGIGTIPASLGVSLPELVYFDLENNNLITLPTEFGELDNLETLVLKGNGFSVFPTIIGGLESLEVLNLEQNSLDQLSDDITKLGNLRELYLNFSGGLFGSGGLTSLPDDFGNLQNLEYLDLSVNRLTTLPSTFGNLINLTTLNLDSNELDDLARGGANIGGLASLESLFLNNNKLSTLPDEISALSQLTDLAISSNEFTSFPTNIPINLTSLNMHGNLLTSIPESISDLVNLTGLDLSNNDLSLLADSIGDLLNLTSLNLRDNALTGVPDISGLTEIEILSVANNALTGIPPGIEALTNFKELYLDFNQIDGPIPENTIGKLTTLAKLKLNDNLIDGIPTDFENLENLTELSIQNNDFEEIPQEVCDLMDSLIANQVPPFFVVFQKNGTVCD